ncbi:MAG: T9SS type A sorting domain-containing protein [Bacteroidota bacterium]
MYKTKNSRIGAFIAFSFLAMTQIFAQNVPIDFEPMGNGADWAWTTFENDANPALEIVNNPAPGPLNNSNTVAKFTALAAGQPFAGIESMHGSDIGSFTITAENSIIRITVWKSVISNVGIKLVREDNWSLGEILIPNTVVNEWEQIEYDFSSHIGNNYDQIVIFPDFADRDSTNIIYFDNVYGGLATPNSIQELDEVLVTLAPNPSHDFLTITSEKAIENVVIYSNAGARVLHIAGNDVREGIDISDLAPGLYLAQIAVEGRKRVLQFVKE